jgi:arylsulfatase A-like enzyme
MSSRSPGDLTLVEALLIGLALSSAVVIAESAGLVAEILTIGALAGASDALLRVWLDVAAVVVPLGMAAALLARALRPGPERRSVALLAVLLAPAAAALIHTTSLGAPVLRRAYGGGALLGAGAATVAVLVALTIAGWRARPALRSLATACLVLAVLALGTGLQWTSVVRTYVRLDPDWPRIALACGVAALPLGLALRRAHQRRATAPLLASLAAYALLGAVGVHLVPPPVEPELERRLVGRGATVPERPPLVLIVADTLRADFVSTLGAPAGTTPHLDSLARDGVVFENTRSTSPWTIPSFASLLTSTYPSEHGAGERGGSRLRRRPLSPRVPTLSEVLGRAGYANAAVVSNAFLGPVYGLARGFHSYENLGPTRLYYPIPAWLHGVFLHTLHPSYARAYVRGDRQTARILDRLELLRSGKRPFALLAHYMDTHRPYQVRGRFRDEEPAPAEVANYRAAVRFLDDEVGAVLEALRAAGLYERSLVVFTADHGEELAEDRLPGDHDHGHTLHRELLRVPLIVKLPDQRLAGTRRSEGASLIDVAPTVLGALGLPAPQGFRGVDLLAEGAPRDALRERTLFAETLLQGPEQKAAIRGELKVVLDALPPRLEHAVGFDRSSDPGESRPLSVAGDPRFEPLYDALAAHVAEARSASRPRERAPALEPDLRRDLEALGYAR